MQYKRIKLLLLKQRLLSVQPGFYDISSIFPHRFYLFSLSPTPAPPLFKPAALLLFPPFAITVNHFSAAAPGEQPAYGIHLAEHFPDLRFSVMLLPVAMGYEITDKMSPCGIPAFSLREGNVI
jgi:hypothetical protein